MGVKKFKFRLEKLLNIKKQEEKQLQIEFFALKNELNSILSKIEYKEKEIKDSFELFKEEVAKNIDYFGKWQNYISLLKEQKNSLENLKEEKQNEVEKKRKELLTKIKERKSLETLREKKYLEYLKEINKEELNFIDEINTSRYNKKGD